MDKVAHFPRQDSTYRGYNLTQTKLIGYYHSHTRVEYETRGRGTESVFDISNGFRNYENLLLNRK